jgi:hypothetical protein
MNMFTRIRNRSLPSNSFFVGRRSRAWSKWPASTDRWMSPWPHSAVGCVCLVDVSCGCEPDAECAGTTLKGAILVSTQVPGAQTAAGFDIPEGLQAFRKIKLLAAGYAGLSVLTLAAIVVLQHHPAIVNSAVWTRGSIVVASSLLTCGFAVQAARGARGAYRRLRLISAAMVAVIAVIVSLPGTFPAWMKIEQGVCGVMLVGIVVLVNSKHVRGLYARR